MLVLVINSGSSSLKYQVRDVEAGSVLAEGLVEKIGMGTGAMAVTGKSLQEARDGLWLLGPFTSTRLWEPWTMQALQGADWSAVLGQAAGIASTPSRLRTTT